ncbi:MAG: DNA polymerase I [Prevotellaceae bacterium]|jgi:DNA polymerase-1|nr:DNA polymerase I [Prevotellaceae bacterium]
MKKLFLLDAFALIYRAYYAFIKKTMVNAQGLNTSAIFGFTKTLADLIRRENPTHIAVCFDPGGKTFRHSIYPAYKANRSETPEVILQSVPIIKEVIAAFNIPIITVPDFEADDVIGTLAKKAEAAGFVTYMMTPDKDYGQLVTDNILIFRPARWGKSEEKIGIYEICKQYGIQRPEQVIDVLALWGDSSDNVPGAPGIGEKTATKLVAQYGTLEGVIEHLHELSGKTREAIAQNIAQLELAKKLVTIDLNVPVELNEELLQRKELDKTALCDLFSKLEFHSLARELLGGSARAATKKLPDMSGQGDLFGAAATATPAQAEAQAGASAADAKQYLKTIADVPHTYRIAQSVSEVKSLCDMLMQQPEFCFDSETDGINPITAGVVGLSFAVKPHEAWFVPLSPHEEHFAEKVELLRAPLENERIAKAGQNIKFDYLVLKRIGIALQGDLLDTMLAHYLLKPDMRHNMNFLAEVYLSYQPVPIESLIGSKKDGQRNMSQAPLEQVAEYAAEDADVTLQLRKVIFDELHKEAGLRKLYEEIEAPLVYVLGDMEWEGVRIDAKGLAEYGKELSAELQKFEKEIQDITGEPALNVFSPKQLGDALFDKLKISDKARTTGKTKQYSTSEDTLMALRDKHPVIDKVLELRGLKKLLSSYVETLPTLVNPQTGHIHTSFNQAVTSTGRLSSNNPNLQNIPIRDERGREIRKAFIPSDENHILLAADYSQVELRIMAHLSNDANLVEAFLKNEDIHASTASKIFHVPIDKVSKEQRRRAKTANFGIIYGISAYGLAQRLNIPRGEAKILIDGYFETYPQVRDYIDNAIQTVRDTGYVQTLCGRRRELPDIKSQNVVVRGFAERYAINAPIQGSAADIIKLAMIKIHRRLRRENLQSRMILQVHDELVFDVLTSELEAVKQLVISEMEAAYKLVVPLIAEAGTGSNWLNAH